MHLKVLGSSSKSNCYIIEKNTEVLIVECGVSYKDIQVGLNFSLNNIKGCLLSHFHHDHSKSIKDLMSAGIECYMSRGTANALDLSSHRLNIVSAGNQFDIGPFSIVPFETQHDAPEPLGYLIQYRPTGEKLLFATDTYYLKNRFNGLNYIMVECNYIKETLDQNIELGLISAEMKPRLLQSHFSLEHLLEFFKSNDLSQVREIILLHLSDNNSDAAIMLSEIVKQTGIHPKIADAGMEVDFNLYPY